MTHSSDFFATDKPEKCGGSSISFVSKDSQICSIFWRKRPCICNITLGRGCFCHYLMGIEVFTHDFDVGFRSWYMVSAVNRKRICQDRDLIFIAIIFVLFGIVHLSFAHASRGTKGKLKGNISCVAHTGKVLESFLTPEDLINTQILPLFRKNIFVKTIIYNFN